MAKYQKRVLILIGAAICAASARDASAQTPFQCFANGGVSTPARSESLADQVGDLTVVCVGGTPTAPGSPVPSVNIQVFLNTSITSKLLAGNWSEALLLIDEPVSAAQRVCGTSGDLEPQSGVCTITGTGTGAGVYSGATGRPNVFQGSQAGVNSLLWTGVPIDPPGDSGARVVRITNVRANVNALGVAGVNMTPTPVVETISPTPSQLLPISNPSQTVAFIQRGLTFSLNTPQTFLQCNSENAALATNPASSGVSQFSLRFTETFATAFKKRNTATTPANPGALANQNSLTVGTYNTESGFYNSSFPVLANRGNLAVAGLADQGTRLIARFSNVPSGVLLFSQISGVISGGGTDAVRMVNTDANGNGPYSATVGNSFGIAPMPVTNGAAMAVYEFVQSDPNTFAAVDIPIYVAYIANAGFNSPALSTATVNASYAPLSSTTAASATESVPRFVDTSTAVNAFTIGFCPCTTFSNGSSASFGSAGGPGSITVTASNTCAWNAFSLSDWISVTPIPTQFGNGVVNYAVSGNTSSSSRSGIVWAGREYTVNQAGVSCTFSVSPSSAAFGTAGGTGSFSLTTSSGSCLWTAVSNSAWITITSGASGAGSGAVGYSVAANTGLPRIGTITAGGQTYTINEAGIGASTGLRFVPVAPCRVIDTRSPAGPFGGPSISGGSVRDVAIPLSACGIPSNAAAYSLNVTVVPIGALAYLTLWPAGQAQPFVSTLNSFDGRIKANAAIVPAGVNGAVSIYVTNTTDVVLDINGYFVPASGAANLAFYPVTPCRIADTRNPAGTFGGPSMAAGQTRAFSVPSAGCGIPATAQAYSLNMTVVPSGPLSFLTTWPSGQAQPFVSTLNALTGTVTANAAIVPSGGNGAINVYVTHPTDLVIDINGYFAPPGSPGELLFYPVTPCRISDTRNPVGTFGGPVMSAGQSRNYPITTSSCSLPATAKAYSLNATVVPGGALGYLTLWPTGQGQPFVSTLNSFDGSVVANAAIVPAGTSGSATAYVTNLTDLILDVNGYFAP